MNTSEDVLCEFFKLNLWLTLLLWKKLQENSVLKFFFFLRCMNSLLHFSSRKGRFDCKWCEEKSDGCWSTRLNQTALTLMKHFLTDRHLMTHLLCSATKTPVCCHQGPLKAAALIALKYLYLFISFVYRIFSMLTQQLRRWVNARLSEQQLSKSVFYLHIIAA